MKTTFIIAGTAVAVLGTASGLEELALDGVAYRRMFDDFVTKYGKSYDEAEHSKRYAAYVNNVKRVAQHNKEADAGKHTFWLAINEVADLTDAEYKAMLGKQGKQRKAATLAELDMSVAAPTSWDWRSKGVVGPVKDQGQCGSCWSFSTVASLEGLYAKKTGNYVALSEQNLVDCVANGTFTCDTGGLMETAFDYVQTEQSGKISVAGDYPYTTTSGNKCRFDSSKAVGSFGKYVAVPSKDEKALLNAVYQNPVISVAIDASSYKFQMYSRGVYTDTTCGNTENALNHGVAIVGYGTSSGKPYWIVRNSWGSSWGNQGYIWMARNKNTCGIALDCTYATWA